jgi:site-specific DNA-cytosine methylase
MKVLVGFEYSGIVAEAFRKHGHEAYSCDIISGNIPEFHIQKDFFEVVQHSKYDLVICHPPCQYLCKAQIFRLKDTELFLKMLQAVEIVKRIMSLNIQYIAVENPIGILSSRFRPPDQIIYPYNFGDIHRKDICLWLKNLPPLIDTCISLKRIPVKNHVNSRMSQEVKSKIKSKFFPLVADAMAVQWGSLPVVNK